MSLYALIKISTGEFIETRDFVDPPVTLSLPQKDLEWRPAVRLSPTYNPLIEHIGPVEVSMSDGIVTLTPTVLRLSEEEAWLAIRRHRNRLLSESDWTQLPDANTDKELWASYRQVLRDLPNQTDPYSIVWPSPPT